MTYKQTLIFLSLMCAALACNARSAIMVAHYGSSDDATRALTIDKITADIAAEFPQMDVRQAYISPIVRNRMKAAGLAAPSPEEMLQTLAADGIDTVYVQSSTIIEGAETAEVRAAARAAAPDFKLIKVGNPLCYSPDDCMELVKVLAQQPQKPGEAIVWCGHGNNLPSTATYAMLDYMLAHNGTANMHVSTIEGYPTAQSTIDELALNPEIKHVKLIPLLLVCGNHTKNDIAGEYAAELNKAGYSTEVVMQGLAENPGVRGLYIQRIKILIN